MNKYIIVELIPSASTKEKGDIVQLSALKINNLDLIDRFDYRIKEEKIIIPDLLNIINYDKDKFISKETTNEILKEFEKWSENLPLLILNNDYTLDYLKDLKNIKKDISDYIKIPYSDNIIEKIIEKYHLQPTNYIVDLLYEALIYSSNK